MLPIVRLSTALVALLLSTVVQAQTNSGVNDWLMRMHDAGKHRSYAGTYVVTNNLGVSGAKIWHVCDGVQQMERVESLSGQPRTTLRHDDEVLTYLPVSKTAILEKRENLSLFPNMLQSTALPDHYQARLVQKERVAAVQTQVLDLMPKDQWRYGYRIWVEEETGLVIKVRTLDVQGQILEEAAFLEIDLQAPVKMDSLRALMKARSDESQGVKVYRPQQVKTTAAQMGWSMKSLVPGFKPISCYKRGSQAANEAQTHMQWIFSDGLATVSVFAEPYDKRQQLQEMTMRVGATQSLARRVNAYWVTLMGEVPLNTLKTMAESLEHSKP